MTSSDYKDNSIRTLPQGLELVREFWVLIVELCTGYENAFG